MEPVSSAVRLTLHSGRESVLELLATTVVVETKIEKEQNRLSDNVSNIKDVTFFAVVGTV